MPQALTRRGWLGAAAAGLALSAGGGRLTQAHGVDMSLAKAAAGGRYFGAAVRSEQLRWEGDLRQAVLRDCDWLTPEIALKWAAMEPVRGEMSFGPMDALAAFAQAHGKSLHGHTLIWHRSVPDWAKEALLADKDWGVIQKHFASTISRYNDSIQQWDVINEPIETGQRMDGLRDSVFLRAFGPDYIGRALEEARGFAPKARLMINEFGLDYDIPVEKDRRYLFLKLIERLKKANAPLDGVGLQAHLDLGKGPFSERVFEDFLQELAGFGLFVVVTELDVKEYDYTLPTEDRDREVAEAVARYLDVALAQPAVHGVITWGLSDRHSWLEVTPEDLARYEGRWDGGQGPGFNRGLPLNSSMRPKALYYAIEAAFRRHAPEPLP